MSTPASKIYDFSSIEEPAPPAAPRAPVRAPAPPVSTDWALSTGAPKVKDWYRQTFGADLPITSYGQDSYHVSQNLDHRNAFDVALSPSSKEGQALVGYLKSSGVPFRAITADDVARGVKASGPHIHVGPESHGIGSQPAYDFSSIEEPSTPAPKYDFSSIEEPDTETETVDVNDARQQALKLPPPKLRDFDPYDPKQRQRRDAATTAIQNGATPAITVRRPEGVAKWSDLSPSELMRLAYATGANQYGDAHKFFVNSWLDQHPDYARLVNNQAGDKDVSIEDVLKSSAYDPRTDTITLALHHLPELEKDYKDYRSLGDRAVDWAIDPNRTAGEKFDDLASPVAAGVSKVAGTVGEYAQRLLDAISANYWSRMNRASYPEALLAFASPNDPQAMRASLETLKGNRPESAQNPFVKAAEGSSTLREINPYLPGVAGGLASMLTEPGNFFPIEEAASGGKLLRELKPVARLEEALKASGDARAAEFFARGGRILDVELPERAAGAVAERAAADDAPRLGVVTFRDPDGRIFKLDTSTGQLTGDVPPLPEGAETPFKIAPPKLRGEESAPPRYDFSSIAEPVQPAETLQPQRLREEAATPPAAELPPPALPAGVADSPRYDFSSIAEPAESAKPPHHSNFQPRDAGGTFVEGKPARADLVNLDKFNVSDAEKENLSKLVSEYAAENGYEKKRVTFDDVKREAAQLDPSLVRDLKPVRDGVALNPAVRYAAKQRLSAINAEHARVLDAISAGRDSLPLDELQKLESKAATLKRDADSMLGVLLPLRTQAGRTLAMERMMVDATGFDLEKSVGRARRIAERSGVDVKSEPFQKAEGAIRQTVARGAESQRRLDELEARIAEAQVSPEMRAAVEEAARLKRRLGREPSEREAVTAARRAVAESYKAKLAAMEQAARARLREKLSSTSIHDVTDIASMIADLSVVGASKLARGGIDRAVWAREMLDEFGQKIGPHLKPIFAKSYELYQSELKAARQKAAELRIARKLVAEGDISKFTNTEIERLLNAAAEQRARVQRARMDLAKTYASLQKTDKWSTLSAIRKSNLLGTVGGAARDLVSTGLFQPTEQLARIPGSLADLTLSLVSKNDRQLLSAQPASLLAATKEGYAKALREIPEVIRHGATKEQLERLELPHEINSGSRLADAYVKVVGRYRTAVDLPAFNQAEAFALRERAKLQALAEKRAGKIADVKARAAELVAKPPDALRILAATDAAEVTFHGTTKASEAIRRARTALSPGGNFALDLVLPFERATTGVFHKGVQYSGLGIPEAGYRTLRAAVTRSLSPQEQRSIALAFGRGATGVLAFVPLGYALAARGVVTGAVDDEPGQRGLKQVAGRKPMSIYNPTTGDWINIDVLGPAALPIAIGATVYQERSQPKGAGASEYTKQILRLGVTAPQVRAAGEVSRLVNSPAPSIPGFVGRTVGSFVAPGVSSEVADLADSKERETNTFAGGLASRVPGLRNTLPPRLDALGQQVTGYSKESDPLTAEAMRIRLPIEKPKEKDGQTAKAFRRRLTDEGSTVRASLSALFDSDRYKSLPDDDARRSVASGVMEYARQAERDGLPRAYATHNALVRAEALRVADDLSRDRSLTVKQRSYVESGVSRLLSSAMIKKDEKRDVEGARRELAGIVREIDASLPSLIREARAR